MMVFNKYFSILILALFFPLSIFAGDIAKLKEEAASGNYHSQFELATWYMENENEEGHKDFAAL